MKKYCNYIKENNDITYDGDFVANYVIEISEETGNDIPDFFIEEYIIPSKFKLTKLKISELSKSDIDFNEYLQADDDRYEETNEYPNHDNLFNPIVVFNDIVLDGYNRMTILTRMNIDDVDAYVNIDNKNMKINI